MVTDGATFINPLGLTVTLLLGFMMLVLPRRFALAPMIIIVCYITMGQCILIMGLNFTMMRILVLFGWARLVLRGEIRALEWNAVDKAIICWTLSSLVFYTLLWQTSEALINRLGLMFNAIGIYFLFRFLVQDLSDIKRTMKVIAVVIMPLAILMLAEKMTGTNAFAVFGGVPEVTAVRDGVLRSQGPFEHPILAGTFGATLVPLFCALWWESGSNLYAALGVISATIITVTSGSSGPIMAYVFGLVGVGMWPLRKHMRLIRWTFVFAVVGLALVMKAPVWYLIARVNVFSGSTGYHRSYLIDQAINHFSEWWVTGTKSTANWGEGLFDVTNQYVWEGVNGGLLTLILFICIIVYSFRHLGRAIRIAESEPIRERIWLWVMGAALFAHVISFISVSYFDQIVVIWYLLLAMISSASGLPNLIAKATPAAAESDSGMSRIGIDATPAGYRNADFSSRQSFSTHLPSQKSLLSLDPLGNSNTQLSSAGTKA